MMKPIPITVNGQRLVGCPVMAEDAANSVNTNARSDPKIKAGQEIACGRQHGPQ